MSVPWARGIVIAGILNGMALFTYDSGKASQSSAMTNQPSEAEQ